TPGDHVGSDSPPALVLGDLRGAGFCRVEHPPADRGGRSRSGGIAQLSPQHRYGRGHALACRRRPQRPSARQFPAYAAGDLARGQWGLSRGISGSPQARHAPDKHERRRRYIPAAQALCRICPNERLTPNQAPKGTTAMNERIWDKFLTERDKAVFAAGGFGARAGFGKRPALLVIDVSWAFCGERPEP